MRPRLIWRGCANLGPAAAVGLRIPIAFPAYVSHVARSRANVVPVSSCLAPARNSCPATAGITTATADADADVALCTLRRTLPPIADRPLPSLFPSCFRFLDSSSARTPRSSLSRRTVSIAPLTRWIVFRTRCTRVHKRARSDVCTGAVNT